ncbi:hypothetical protein PS467_41320 [Streptomyces luomodiensis]|uniref:Uncharacterized protein n=1 Tax=Streptomyces luomodiensis TaxID=3026192 RepID=A0ABY9VF28_9ACTN|nr:hypothetical protein [Streptomyces sp. SCA4-21]WNF01321.1 hypothetical protein PS467_41320 [Streptomyces sp. SCA4-21]
MDLIAAGDEVAARWLDDPQEAVALVRELAGSRGCARGGAGDGRISGTRR